GQALTASLLLAWLALAPPVFASALAALRRGWRDPARGARPLALAASAVLAPALVVALAAGTKPNGGLLGFAYALALLGAALLPAGRANAALRLLAAAGCAAAASGLALALLRLAHPH